MRVRACVCVRARACVCVCVCTHPIHSAIAVAEVPVVEQACTALVSVRGGKVVIVTVSLARSVIMGIANCLMEQG